MIRLRTIVQALVLVTSFAAYAGTNSVVTTPNSGGSLVNGNLPCADSTSEVVDCNIPTVSVQRTVATAVAFRMATLTTVQLVYVRGMVTTGDTGAGLFRNIGTTSCTDDGGVVLKDAGGNCFLRDKIATTPVSLKMYGYTAGSDQATFCGGGDCLVKAFSAAQTYGNNAVTTDTLVVTSGSDVAPLSAQDFTCGATQEGLQTTGSLAAVPGSIIFTHGHGLRYAAGANNIHIHHCVDVTNGSGGTAINLSPATQRDLLDDLLAMRANGDTGVLCDGQTGGESPELDHVTIAGFDSAIAIYKCARVAVHDVYCDANVGYFQGPVKSPTSVSRLRCRPLLGTNVTQDLPVNYTAIAASGGALSPCRLTVADTSPFRTGDMVNLVMDRIAGDVNMGPLSCYGVWAVTVVDGTHLDLQTSVYATGLWYTSGTASWTSGSHVLHVPPPSTAGGQGIYRGETVNCGGGARTGTVKYTYVAPPANNGGSGLMGVVIDTAAASSSTGTCTFINLGAYVHGAASCSTSNVIATDSGCLYLYTTQRFTAGNSYAGLSTGNLAAGVWAGGPGDTSPGGFVGNDIYMFGYRHQYDGAGAGPFYCAGCNGDSDKELLDPLQLTVHYGSGVPWLLLSGTTTSGQKQISVSFDPRKAGWAVGDFITGTGIPDHGSSCGGNPIASLNATSVTITDNATASGTVTVTDQGSDNGACGTYRNYTSAAYFNGPQITGGGYMVDDSGSAGVNIMEGIQINPQNLGTPALVIMRGKLIASKLHTTQDNAFIVDSNATQAILLGSGSVTANTGPIYWDGLAIERASLGSGNYFLGGGLGNFENFGNQNSCDATHVASDQIGISVCSGSAMVGNPSGGACGDGCLNAMTVKTNQYTVATLPTCNAGNKGLRAFATDLTGTAFNGAVTGGGANIKPIFCDGSNWLIGMLENWRLDWPRTPANDNDAIEERRYG